ncbi:hypothetical protein BU17DRAFT_60459 [Hysterangium stoloniferum]|nr:hypothetical protein BU17DRAFT_60459 [Hysterangium stoloniferum]
MFSRRRLFAGVTGVGSAALAVDEIGLVVVAGIGSVMAVDRISPAVAVDGISSAVVAEVIPSMGPHEEDDDNDEEFNYEEMSRNILISALVVPATLAHFGELL